VPQLILHITRPAYRHRPLHTLDYKFGDGALLVYPLTPTLQNESSTLPWKLPVSSTPACHWVPEANRALLLLPRRNQRIQIPILRGTEALPAAERPILIRQGTRQADILGDMRLRRFSPPTRVGTSHNLLPTSWLHDRPTQGQCHHTKRRGIEVCGLLVVLTSDLLDPVYQLAQKMYTMFPLWEGSCTFSGGPLSCGEKSSIGSFGWSTHAHIPIAHEFIVDPTMGITLHTRHDPGTDVALSYCFEELCARSTAKKPHGTFFSVVTRKVGELNVIMAGEVDCSLSMRYDQSVSNCSLTSTLRRQGAPPGELH